MADSTTFQLDVEIVVPCYPTEVRDRVAEAISTLFPTASIEDSHGELVGQCHSLDHFRDRLQEQAIVASARSALLDSIEGDTITFALKKQAARHDVINFSVGDPDELGDMQVRIQVTGASPRVAVDHIAPTSEE